MQEPVCLLGKGGKRLYPLIEMRALCWLSSVAITATVLNNNDDDDNNNNNSNN
jgi:hypothetical protein